MLALTHSSVSQSITTQLVDSLITQLDATPKPRARQVIVRQLYGVGATVNDIAHALESDLQAGDAILNQRTDEEQNEAPETQMWLTWLAQYEECHRQLARISAALQRVPEGEAA